MHCWTSSKRGGSGSGQKAEKTALTGIQVQRGRTGPAEVVGQLWTHLLMVVMVMVVMYM